VATGGNPSQRERDRGGLQPNGVPFRVPGAASGAPAPGALSHRGHVTPFTMNRHYGLPTTRSKITLTG
jgi:hypothetical protein